MSKNKDRGFSLVELLAAVGLMSLLIAIAVPEFSTLKGQMQASEDVRRVAGILQQVRSEAIRTKSFAKVTFTSNSVSWDFFNDGTSEGTFQLDPTSSFPSTPSAILFNGLGLARGISGDQTFTVNNRSQSSTFTINSNGYVER